MVEKTLDVGEAVNVWATKPGNLQYAGQVITVQTSVPVRKNLSAQGNFRPVPVSIQTITPSVAEGLVLESGDFTIQIYGDRGAIEASYTYCFGEDIDQEADGWYEEDLETLVEKTFAAGEGFNIWAAKAGSLTFPALSL